MSHDIRREAADIAEGLDNGDTRWATDRLRQDLYQMHPDDAMELVRQIQQREQQGYGSDLIVSQMPGRGGRGRGQQEFLSVEVESVMYDRRSGREYYSTQPVGTIALPYYDQRPGRPYPGHGGGHHGGHRRGGDDNDIVPFLGGVAVGTVLGIILNNGNNRRGGRRR
jgi:hypothetical protein